MSWEDILKIKALNATKMKSIKLPNHLNPKMQTVSPNPSNVKVHGVTDSQWRNEAQYLFYGDDFRDKLRNFTNQHTSEIIEGLLGSDFSKYGTSAMMHIEDGSDWKAIQAWFAIKQALIDNGKNYGWMNEPEGWLSLTEEGIR